MDRLFDWLGLALVIAGIFLFLRPGSQGPVLVEKSANGIVGVIHEVTGGGGWWPR